MRHRAMLSPLEAPPFHPWSQTIPLMTGPKNTTARHVIIDLTRTHRTSANSGLRRGYYQGNQCTYSLPDIMDIADEVARLGPDCYL